VPYIKQEDRKDLDPLVHALIIRLKDRPIGALNYVISKLIWTLFEQCKSYTRGNALVGCLECIKNEFVRRKLNPYEEKKIQENGDVKIEQELY